jgi:antitoxin YefM
MKPMRVAEDILTIADFKARASEVVRKLRGHSRPVVVTQNGKPAAVLLAPEEYDRLTSRARFLVAVGKGLSDVAAGHVISDRDLGRSLDEEFGTLEP